VPRLASVRTSRSPRRLGPGAYPATRVIRISGLSLAAVKLQSSPSATSAAALFNSSCQVAHNSNPTFASRLTLAELACRGQPFATWTKNVSFTRLALPVSCQQPGAVNVIVLAQKCGARASPCATLARSGFAGPSRRLPAIRKSRPADRAPHQGNLAAIEPSRCRSPKTVPGGGGRAMVTTSTPSTGIWVQSSLPKSVGSSSRQAARDRSGP
jgi:hypothetical protein